MKEMSESDVLLGGGGALRQEGSYKRQEADLKDKQEIIE